MRTCFLSFQLSYHALFFPPYGRQILAHLTWDRSVKDVLAHAMWSLMLNLDGFRFLKGQLSDLAVRALFIFLLFDDQVPCELSSLSRSADFTMGADAGAPELSQSHAGSLSKASGSAITSAEAWTPIVFLCLCCRVSDDVRPVLRWRLVLLE